MGGVAILLNKSEPSEVADGLHNPNIEMISTVTNWAKEISHVSCIYKDHDMPKNVFLTEMENVFESHSLYPSIIAGDFNLYDDENKHNESLNSCALRYGFVPTVHQEPQFMIIFLIRFLLMGHIVLIQKQLFYLATFLIIIWLFYAYQN